MTHCPGDTMLYVAHRNRPNHLNHILGSKSNAMDSYIKEEGKTGATPNSITFLSNIYRNCLNII